MAALSFRVHSATTLALISFMYNMKAFRGFFTWGFFSSSFFTVTGDFLGSGLAGVSCYPAHQPPPPTSTKSRCSGEGRNADSSGQWLLSAPERLPLVVPTQPSGSLGHTLRKENSLMEEQGAGDGWVVLATGDTDVGVGRPGQKQGVGSPGP